MTPERCISTYNRITRRLCGRRVRPLTHSANMLGIARRFLAWASARGIDPRHWIIARHEASGWAYRIPMAKMTQASPEFLARYNDWIADKLAAMDQEVADRRRVEPDTNRVESTTCLGEAQKAVWADTPKLCLSLGYSITGGWHPASVHCQACALAADCRRSLPAPVLRRRVDARG